MEGPWEPLKAPTLAASGNPNPTQTCSPTLWHFALRSLLAEVAPPHPRQAPLPEAICKNYGYAVVLSLIDGCS